MQDAPTPGLPVDVAVDLALDLDAAVLGAGLELPVRRARAGAAPDDVAELTRRFGSSRWSFALTATDANRWAVRLARAVTGRSKVLFNSYCYHGSVDESLIVAFIHVMGTRQKRCSACAYAAAERGLRPRYVARSRRVRSASLPRSIMPLLSTRSAGPSSG